MLETKKKVGLGSLALLISLLAFFIQMMPWNRNITIIRGDISFVFYTESLAFILCIVAIYLGTSKKYCDNMFATLGKKIAILFLLLNVVILLIGLLLFAIGMSDIVFT